MSCNKPPVGWSCSREEGHDGPCAASEKPVDDKFSPKRQFRFLLSFLDEDDAEYDDKRFPAFCVQTVRFLDNALSIGFVSMEGMKTVDALKPFVENSAILLRLVDREGSKSEDIVIRYSDEELLLGDLDYSSSDPWICRIFLGGLTLENR